MAGVICGRLFNAAASTQPALAPRKGNVCKEGDSSELRDVAPVGQKEETATESGQESSFVTKESLASLLQNWTDGFAASTKNAVQKELKSLERRLKRRLVKKCPKESAKTKGECPVCTAQNSCYERTQNSESHAMFTLMTYSRV